MFEPIFFIVVQEDGQEVKVNLTPRVIDDSIAVDMGINGKKVSFGKQQLMEFGVLLLAIAGKQDVDSAQELLDGYGLDPKPVFDIVEELQEAYRV